MEFFQKLKTKHFIAIIFLVGFLVYLNIFPNGFVWDDEEQIVNNTLIQNLGNLPQLLTSSTFQTGGTGTLSGYYYRPTMTISFMANFALWKLNPFGYHFFQLMIHLLNASLVFLILNYLFQDRKLKNSLFIVFAVALIWLVHPANVEAVGYIASTQEVLYTLFSLLALFVFLRGKEFKKGLVISLVFVFLALLSKESAVMMISIIFFYLLLFRKKEQAFSFAGFSSLVFLVYAFLRIVVAKIPLNPPHFSPIAGVSLVQRLQTVPFILFSYLRLIFYPLNLSISHHEIIKSLDLMFWGPLAVVLAVFLGLGFYLWKSKNKLGLFFFLWFTVSMAFVLNIFPLDMTYAERWLYLPLIGFLGLLAGIFAELQPRLKRLEKIFPFLLLCLLLLFSARTFSRSFDWRNGLTLFSHDRVYSQNSFDLENNLGVELFRVGKIKEAKTHFEKSISLQPDWWFPYNNLGAVYQQEGDLKKARELYEESIEKGNYFLAHENLAFVVLKTEEPKKAIEIIQKSLNSLPYNLRLWTALTLGYYQDEQFEKAEELARKLYSSSPNNQTRGLLEAILNRKEINF
jgi:hypothetical protein